MARQDGSAAVVRGLEQLEPGLPSGLLAEHLEATRGPGLTLCLRGRGTDPLRESSGREACIAEPTFGLSEYLSGSHSHVKARHGCANHLGQQERLHDVRGLRTQSTVVHFLPSSKCFGRAISVRPMRLKQNNLQYTC